jgi:hypothetical protein
MLNLKKSGTVTLGTVTSSDIDDSTMRLAQQLSKKHGNAKIMMESGGVHIYIASPICLELYGDEELLPSKMHLAINADKYLGKSPYKQTDMAALCMKTGTIYQVSDLITGKNLKERGFVDRQHQVQLIEKKDYLEDDGNGNMVPFGPGDTTPLTDLPITHPALQYLRSRDFDPVELQAQFRAAYCSEDRRGVFYRKLPYGFKAGPCGRIVFYIDVKGAQRGWQARMLDYKARGTDGKLYHFFWNPYSSIWFPVKVRDDVTGKWELTPGSDKWDPPKYIIAYGAKRNEVLMGYDAIEDNSSWIGLTEGPLDAARLGPPFCAVMGKHFSAAQAELCRGFSKVVLAMQNDAASDEFRSRVTTRLQLLGIPCNVMAPPHSYNDFGDMSADAAWKYFEDYKIKNNINK